MGTSASSKGPGSGVPLIPPWVEPVEPLPLPPNEETEQEGQMAEPSDEDGANNDGSEKDAGEANKESPPLQNGAERVAPARRFGAARRSLGQFAQSGSRTDLGRSLGHYVSSGLGGAGSGTRRMGGTARTAGTLFNAFQELRSGEAGPTELGIDRVSLIGKSAIEVGERITNAISPSDGTQDRESQRDSISRAISELIRDNPDADLMALTTEQIEFLTIRFIAQDLCHRIDLDIGKALFDKADGPAIAVRRTEEMRGFVREQVFACFRSRASRGQGLTRSQVSELCAGVIKDTLTVFEDYLR